MLLPRVAQAALSDSERTRQSQSAVCVQDNESVLTRMTSVPSLKLLRFTLCFPLLWRPGLHLQRVDALWWRHRSTLVRQLQTVAHRAQDEQYRRTSISTLRASLTSRWRSYDVQYEYVGKQLD